MKLLTAIVRPHSLDGIRAALQEVGVTGMTASEVRGYGRQGGHTELYRGAEYKTEFKPKIKIDIALKNELVDVVVEAISGAAKTGKVGDGKLFVVELEQVVRLRTGEIGEQAL